MKGSLGTLKMAWTNEGTDYVVDAAFQGLAYYTMSAITNEPFKLARMAAYYKGIQSAGAAVSFGMDAVEVCKLPGAIFGSIHKWCLSLTHSCRHPTLARF